MLNALGRKERVDEMMRCFSELRARYRPDRWAYTTVIATLLRSGRKQDARQVLDDMLAAGFKMDSLLETIARKHELDLPLLRHSASTSAVSRAHDAADAVTTTPAPSPHPVHSM
jgi:pentatricopeptide repeat protein